MDYSEIEEKKYQLELEYLNDSILRLEFEFDLDEKARVRDIKRLTDQILESYDDVYLEYLNDEIKRSEFDGPLLKRAYLREVEYLNISIAELEANNM